MEDVITLNKFDLLTNKRVGISFIENRVSPESDLSNPVINNLIAAGGESFLYYLRSLGLEYKRNIMILSSKRSYYYDHKDITGVKTLINLEKLNRIKHLESFMSIICNYLSPKTNFIGCFFDKESQNRMKLPSRNCKKYINFSGRGNDPEMDKKEVSYLLTSNGLKVLDITEINGLSYFSARSTERSFEYSFNLF